MSRILSRLAWILIFLGLFLAGDGVKSAVDSRKAPIQFDALTEQDFKNGTIVEGDINFNLGYFAEEYRTTYGIRTGDSNYTYMIPFGDSKYMGLKCLTNEQQVSFDMQAEQSVNVMLGKTSEQPQAIHFKGRIKTMDSEIKGYLKEYMEYIGFTSQEAEQAIWGYTIECVDFKGGMGLFGIGAGCLLAGLVILLLPIIAAKKEDKRKAQMFQNLNNSQTLGMDTVVSYEDPFAAVSRESTHSDVDYEQMADGKTVDSNEEQSGASGLKLKLKE